MILRMIKFINGYVRIRVCGYSPERFLNLCSNHGILIWDLKNCGNAYEMYMSVKGFRKLRPIVRKTRTKVVITRRCGMPFLLHRYRKRKMFAAGIILSVVMIYLFSLFVWDIQFQGNSRMTTEVLMKYLEEHHLHHGMCKKDVDCEKIEAMLRNGFDEIIWTSVEMKGTRLIIHVQESLPADKGKEPASEEPSDLCAEYNGRIERIITRAGTPLVSVGDSVSAGAVLVCGRIEILGDDGSVTGYQYCPSDADIYIRTSRAYHNSFSMTYLEKEYVEGPKESHYVKAFSKVWRLDWKKNKKGMLYEEVSEEKQLHLWNNFYLPFYWGKVTKSYYKTVKKIYTEEEAGLLASKQLEQFCEDLQKKGVQIIENNVTIQVDKNNCVVSGSVVVVEKTGIRKPTEILSVQPQEDRNEYNGTGT